MIEPNRRLDTPYRSRRVLVVIITVTTLVLLGLSAPLRAEAGTDAEPAPMTVRGTVQTFPSGPLEDAEVPVLLGPDPLPAVAADEARLEDDDLVLGVVVGDVAKAYPIRQLGRFEVVDDRLGDRPVAVTWCPLTASGRVFSRRVGERELRFDFVRGLIHDNLLISDRETRSVWSQLGGEATDGPLAGSALEPVPALQTTWAFWKARHPETVVLQGAGEAGPYRYFESAELRMPPLGGPEHDPVSMGLGLMVWGQPVFFPLRELAKAPDPFVIGSGSTAIHVRYHDGGMTAWAEQPDGTLLPGVLAYERGWMAFHPNSRVFEASASCATEGGP